MALMQSSCPNAYSERFPGKEVVVRDPQWTLTTLMGHYLQGIESADPATWRIRPDVVILRPQEQDIFLQTNSHGFLGPEIDFSKKLIAIWGDSTVAGWGRGWIEGLSALYPDCHFINGGVNHAPIESIVLRAIEANARLPIACNIVLPGWCTLMCRPQALELVHTWLHKLLKALPNVLFCTQPTSLNEDVLAGDFNTHVATGQQLGFRAGYLFWPGLKSSPALVEAFFRLINQQNDLMRRVVRETAMMENRFVPVVDLYRRFYTRHTPDFRHNFLDTGHFRVEAYPLLQQVFLEEVAFYCKEYSSPKKY